MSEIAAYTDPMEAAPGERVRLMASTDSPTFTAGLFRLFNGDENPDGPGPRRVPVPSPLDGLTLTGQLQEVAQGSWASVAGAIGLEEGAEVLTLEGWLWPTRPAAGRPQVGAALGSPGRRRGFAVGCGSDGELCAWAFGADGGVSELASGERLHPRRWLRFSVELDPAEGSLRLEWEIPSWPRSAGSAGIPVDGVEIDHSGLVSFGACPDLDGTAPEWLYDGKVAEPQLTAGGRTVASWALEREPAGDRLIDPVGGHDATAYNLPTRAVTGPHWHGQGDFHRKPHLYGAIHFHHDDIDDAGWSVATELTLPPDLDSGVYGIELVTPDGASDTVPIFVPPPRGEARADVAILYPTVSYLAYANERMQDHPKLESPGWLSRPITPDEGDLHLKNHPEYGGSIYDTHADGSGICLSSGRRPVMNMRATHRNWQTHAPRALSADLYIAEFLDREGIAVDTITDHLLHDEGVELLDRYSVVITGSHPEYVTEQMMDAQEQYLDGGGRLIYLGGNGYYWVTSIHPEHPWVVEVRRGIGGVRTWESASGELLHQSTGELGGLWRYRGRDPNRIVGVGFSGQGFDHVAPGYVRRPESHDERAAWIFAGLTDDAVIGEGGLILGGAAGDEIDRHDPRWGTPPHALRLASSEGQHTAFVQLVPEDLPVTHPNTGGDVHPGVRADLVFFETADGGAVFSVGSMAFPGSLLHNDRNNAAATVIGNVIARFRDPTPFPDPPPSEPLPYISQASAIGPIPGAEEPAPGSRRDPLRRR